MAGQELCEKITIREQGKEIVLALPRETLLGLTAEELMAYIHFYGSDEDT